MNKYVINDVWMALKLSGRNLIGLTVLLGMVRITYATGSDVVQAIGRLPPEQQVKVMSYQYQVDISQIQQSNETLRTMLESDAKNPHTTRPYIAKGSFLVVALVTLAVAVSWVYAVVSSDNQMLKAITDGWPFMLALIGPLVTLLNSYFGVLKQEHKNRLDAANGLAVPGGLMSWFSGILRR